MTDRVRIIRHEAVPECGSFEVRFGDGRQSKFLYWDDVASRRLQRDKGGETNEPSVKKPNSAGLDRQAYAIAGSGRGTRVL